MLLLVVCPLLVVNRLPMVFALMVPALAMLTVLPLRMSSLERKVSSLEKSLSLQDDVLRGLAIDLTVLRSTISEHRADFEQRWSDFERLELERQEALQQFQRSIFAITRESLVRTESLAVAERLRFEALARSVESPQRM